MQTKKIIRAVLAFLPIFVLGVIGFASGMSIVHAQDGEEPFPKAGSYTVSLEDVADGTVSFTDTAERKRTLDAGENYVVKVMAKDGYVFKGIVVSNTDGTEKGSVSRQAFAKKYGAEDAEYTLTMPEGNIMVSPWIEKAGTSGIQAETYAARADYMSALKGNIGNIVLADNNNVVHGYWSEGLLGVNGVQAYCINPTIGFQSSSCSAVDALGYGIPQDTLTQCAMAGPLVYNGYNDLSTDQKYLMTQMIIWRLLNGVYHWNYGNIHIAAWSLDMNRQSQILGEVWARLNSPEKDAYIGKGTVYVNGYSQPVCRFYLEPKQKGTVRLTKTSANTEITNGNDCYSLEGAFYGIWKNKECTSGTGLSFTTDKNGVADLNGTLDAGTYFVKEITAPKGYALDPTVYTVQVKPNETAQLNAKDKPQNDPIAILLGKVDKETNLNKPQGSASLEGAQFAVRYFEGQYDTNPEEQGIQAVRQWVVRTDEQGIAMLSETYKVSGGDFYRNSSGTATLPLGTITIQETKPPEGYLLNDEVFVRQITSEGLVETVETYNHPIIPEQSLNLNIVKKLKGTDIVIPGVKFKHTLPDGTTEVVTTDEKGQASVKALTWGLHTIEEVSVPDGYTKNPGKVTFTVAEDNTITVKSNTAKEETGKMTFTVKEDGSAGLTVEDTYAPYRLLLRKNNEKGKALQGAEFTLYSDKACTEELTKGTTKEDGTLEFAELEVETKYYLKETKAPEGYRIPVNPDGSDIVTEIYTKSNPLEDTFESYVNGTKHTEKDGAYAITGTTADRVVNLTVENHTGIKMPETGTPWRLLIVIAGGCCMAGALAYSVKKGKKEGKGHEKDEKEL